MMTLYRFRVVHGGIRGPIDSFMEGMAFILVYTGRMISLLEHFRTGPSRHEETRGPSRHEAIRGPSRHEATRGTSWMHSGLTWLEADKASIRLPSPGTVAHPIELQGDEVPREAGRAVFCNRIQGGNV